MTSGLGTGTEYVRRCTRPRQAHAHTHVQLVVGGPDVLDGLADEWRQLCDEASNDEPFYRPEWIRANLRAFLPDARVVLAVCRDDGRLTAVLPLISERRFFCGLPVRKLRGASNVHSCRFDLLRAKGPAGDAALRAIWDELKAAPGWDLLEFSDVPEDGALGDFARLAAGDGYPNGRWESLQSLWIPLSPSGGEALDFLPSHAGKLRRELERRRRRLAETGEIGVRRVEAPDEHWLDSFYRLESSGWKGARGTAIDCDAATRAFYNEAASAAGRWNYLCLYFLECAGQPIAAQYGLRYRGRYFLPKLAIDERFKAYGPGHLLIEAAARDCMERGLSVFDFTGPWADYKAKWTQHFRRHYWLWIFRDSTYGRLLWSMNFAILAQLKRAARRFRPHRSHRESS